MFDPFSLGEDGDETPEFGEAIRSAPRGTLWAFVLAAVLAQAGLLGVSLGLLFIGFRGRWRLGGVLLAGGLVALAATVAVYRWHRAQSRATD